MDASALKQQLIAARALGLVLELVGQLGPTEESARQMAAIRAEYRKITVEFDPQLLTVNVTLPRGDDTEAGRQLAASHIRNAFDGMLGNFSVLTKTDGAFVVVMLAGPSTTPAGSRAPVPRGCHS